MREKIGLLGGSFNPIHYGHLKMAQAAREELALDRLLIIPDGDPPHKSKELAGKRHRLRMTELAARGQFEVSAMEVERSGKTYTVDTLEVLHSLYPEAELWMIIGADTLHELATWKNPARVFELCSFAVFSRDGLSLNAAEGVRVTRLNTAIPDISATEIRGRVHKGLSLEGYTPPVVENYIGAHRLYDPPVQMPEKDIRKRLKEMVPAGRYKHILGVQQTIIALAERWLYDVQRASLTGLLHDCAKGMALDAMREYVDAQGVCVDAQRKESIALLHAPASAAMARATYGVTDPVILRSIWYHNTGATPMGMLDKLICLADMIEPGRKDYGWLEGLRALAVENLDEAVRTALRQKLSYINLRGKEVHPDTASALASMEKQD